jgi:hypothetical protein
MTALAPEFAILQWLNVAEPFGLAQCRGKVVVVVAFQLLCPGCVEHALPQAKKIDARFTGADVQVIGLHTVFEHHSAMQIDTLRAFLHEYRIKFPVGIDAPAAKGPIPVTMARYAMQGTPTLLLIDRNGVLRQTHFGHTDDMTLGAEIMALILDDGGEKTGAARGQNLTGDPMSQSGCRL